MGKYELTKKKIALYEPDEAKKKLILEFLEQQQVSPVVCASYAEILVHLKNTDFDHVICDYTLTSKDAYQFISQLRKENSLTAYMLIKSDDILREYQRTSEKTQDIDGLKTILGTTELTSEEFTKKIIEATPERKEYFGLEVYFTGKSELFLGRVLGLDDNVLSFYVDHKYDANFQLDRLVISYDKDNSKIQLRLQGEIKEATPYNEGTTVCFVVDNQKLPEWETLVADYLETQKIITDFFENAKGDK